MCICTLYLDTIRGGTSRYSIFQYQVGSIGTTGLSTGVGEEEDAVACLEGGEGFEDDGSRGVGAGDNGTDYCNGVIMLSSSTGSHREGAGGRENNTKRWSPKKEKERGGG